MVHLVVTDFSAQSASIRLIREQVFHQEQGIESHLDWDGWDEQVQHVLAYIQDQPVGTLRMRPLPEQQAIAKLERIAVLKSYRGQGIGSAMVRVALTTLKQQGIQRVILHAQLQTCDFYRHLGFEPDGEIFEEAGIAHMKMVHKFSQ